MDPKRIDEAYQIAKEDFKEYGIDTDQVLKRLESISISLHCWQGDDVGGFEHPNSELSGGGIQVTGNYPGKARTVLELRQDMEKALSLIPSQHRVNLHAIYGEFGGKDIDRDQILPEHFQGWIDWAKEQNVKLDFNSTLFSHPKAESGFTLSSKDTNIRNFWIEHVKRCRKIAEYIGKQLNDTCIHNLWIADGSKDLCVDKMGYRRILKESLDEIFLEKFDKHYLKDSLEGKLFGIGSEAFVVGSHEFYLAYTLKNNIMYTMDMGHFHPTESVADKISSILPFMDEILLHISRGVRWDSDHIVILDDSLLDLAHEVIRSDALNRVHLALDYFDASLNRIGAWVIGARAALKSFLIVLAEPIVLLRELEERGNYFKRLALLENLKSLPYGALWDYFCMKQNVPIGTEWIKKILDYEKESLKKR